MNERLEAALADGAHGRAPRTIALMRILIEASSEDEARTALERAVRAEDRAGAGRLLELRSLWEAHPAAWTTVHSVIDDISHDHRGDTPDDTLRYLAATFDRLAAASPEGSVALYSLGSPELLAAATDEVVARMSDWGLLSLDRDALDLGCGIGRFLRALSPRMRSVTGLDLSPRMVAEARHRCKALGNVTVAQSSGHDLRQLADGSLDLVLAADVFPYLVQAGGELAAAHVVEFRRVLRPSGAALILNFSYRGDRDADRDDLVTMARASSFTIEHDGMRPFELWDAAAFLLRLPAY